MKEKLIKVGTFFSGIGSPEKALYNLKKEGYIKDYKIEFFSEIDKKAIKSYCAIHNIDENLNLGNIVNIKGEELPYCDLWIGGFPCQDISSLGKMKGFDSNNNTRSSLCWQMIRLIKEVKEKPKYIIFENVAMITSNKFKETLNLFKKDLMDLGYNLYEDKLLASDYGIPQKRMRYFLIAILDNNVKFEFPKKIDNKILLKDILEKYVDEKYYLTNSKYLENNSKRIFKHKNKNDIIYEIDMNKYLIGGVCGIDKHSKFNISSKIHSLNGDLPTLTASNTADNCKIVIEGDLV